MISRCLACNEPLEDGRRIDSTTCDSTCRSRLHRIRQARLISLIGQQVQAVNHADWKRLEDLIIEAAAFDRENV